MLDTPGRLLDGAALYRKHDVPRAGADDVDHPPPVDHPVSTGTPDGCAGDLAALGRRVLVADVFGVQVNQPVADVLQPVVGVLAGQTGISRVEIDPYGRGRYNPDYS